MGHFAGGGAKCLRKNWPTPTSGDTKGERKATNCRRRKTGSSQKSVPNKLNWFSESIRCGREQLSGFTRYSFHWPCALCGFLWAQITDEILVQFPSICLRCFWSAFFWSAASLLRLFFSSINTYIVYYTFCCSVVFLVFVVVVAAARYFDA